jgi:small-conductance mechanosensitive channel
MTVADFLSWALPVAIAVLFPFLVSLVINLVLRANSRRWPMMWRGWRRIRRPFTLALGALLLRIGLQARLDVGVIKNVSLQVAEILLIAALVWMVATIAMYALTLAERRLLAKLDTDRDRRRAHTQLRLARRLISVGFVVIAVGLSLLTFPGVERLGAGVLASAGVLSVVAGIAAQSSLGNVFAGIQIAFADAIRIDDIVVVEDEWGRVEDITLTYVVVRIWDERRLILPSSYFTTTPFTNWTRTGTEIVGLVLFELDWRVDVQRMRERLDELLAGTPLWDGRQKSLYVTDTAGGRLTVRVVASAADADDLFVLQCQIREELAAWLRDHNPEGLPVQRIEYVAGREPQLP